MKLHDNCEIHIATINLREALMVSEGRCRVEALTGNKIYCHVVQQRSKQLVLR